MRQFDVYANPSANTRGYASYVVVLQSHYAELETIVIAPLVTDARELDPIDIALEFNNQGFVLAISELGSVSRTRLRRRLGSLSEHEDSIRRALERLFSGF